MRGEDDHFGPWPDLEDLLGGLDSVTFGQLDVDDQDVGFQFLDHIDDVTPVRRLANDLQRVRIGHPRFDRIADDLMIVAEDDPLTVANAGAHWAGILSGEPY